MKFTSEVRVWQFLYSVTIFLFQSSQFQFHSVTAASRTMVATLETPVPKLHGKDVEVCWEFCWSMILFSFILDKWEVDIFTVATI